MNGTTVTVEQNVIHVVTAGTPGPPGTGGGGSYVGGLEPLTNGDPDFPELMFSDGDLLMVSVT